MVRLEATVAVGFVASVCSCMDATVSKGVCRTISDHVPGLDPFEEISLASLNINSSKDLTTNKHSRRYVGNRHRTAA